ncbi:MAG TPA: RNA-binding cell elongation regulator Jag/EloR [Candidatus Krumholzibacteria bacterium]|nr:RNA-binding cell elongation regulator Jag/EloR [Candidatus Krumholzibacteria bacterium]
MIQQRVEATGSSPDAALEKALTELGAKRAEVACEVLDSGGGRWLGLLKGRPARVRVERLVHRHANAAEVVSDLLQAMHIEAQVEMRDTDGVTEITIHTQGIDGLLIGRRGQTLVALEHLVGRLVGREFGQDVQLVVDVGDYRKRRQAQLVQKAQALAEKVRITGREINLEPLHAPDRRTVHMAVADIPGVRSYTVGQGLHRNVVIAPAGRRRVEEPVGDGRAR